MADDEILAAITDVHRRTELTSPRLLRILLNVEDLLTQLRCRRSRLSQILYFLKHSFF